MKTFSIQIWGKVALVPMDVIILQYEANNFIENESYVMHTLKINFKYKLSFEDCITENTPGRIEMEGPRWMSPLQTSC